MKSQEEKFGLNVDFVKKNDKQCFGKIIMSMACGEYQKNKTLIHDSGDLITNMKKNCQRLIREGKKIFFLVPLFPFIARRNWNIQKAGSIRRFLFSRTGWQTNCFDYQENLRHSHNQVEHQYSGQYVGYTFI